MKALTLHQPWAALIAIGAKTIETRSWSTKYRGPLAIHAGARLYDREVVESFSDVLGSPWPMLPLGAIVASCVLVDCVPIVGVGTHEQFARPFPFVLVDRRPGQQPGLWLMPGPEDGRNTPIHDQRPYGDFTPGRFAWLLDDIKPTTERCPACWGEGGFKEDTALLYGIPGGRDWSHPCDHCNPRGKNPPGDGYGCEPVPAKGRQGLWNIDAAFAAIDVATWEQ